MNLTRINSICYKAVCLVSCITAIAFGIQILFDHLLVKGFFGLVSAAIFALLLFQRPSIRTSFQVIAVIVVTAVIISELAKI